MSPSRGSRGPVGKGSTKSTRAPGTPRPIGSADEPSTRATKSRSAGGGAKSPARRRPATVDRGDSFRVERLAKSRYGIVYDIDGPRIRLGVAWFVGVIVVTYIGVVPLALLVGAIAALAGAQTAQALRTSWRRPDRAVAAIIAGLIPLAAAAGTAMAGLVIIAAAFAALLSAGRGPGKRRHPLIDAGAVIRSSVFVGLAGASLLMLYRFDIGAVVTLVLLLSAYEAGDYLVGSGSSNVVEGPLSGVLTVIVVAAALAAVVPPAPFTAGGLWLYAVVAAMAAPIGQVLASAILPRAGAPARALRRLDSYLFAGPLWLVLLWSGVGI